jgi:hypothetical protein
MTHVKYVWKKQELLVSRFKMSKQKQIEPLINWKKAKWVIIGLVISIILLVLRYKSIAK